MFERIFALKIFEGIPNEVVQKIINNSPIRKYNPKEIIIREWDDPSSEAFIIKEWNVAVFIWQDKVAELGSWDIFWEMWLLNEEPRSASVLAISEVEVFVINFDTLMEMISNWSEVINKTVIKRIEENLSR